MKKDKYTEDTVITFNMGSKAVGFMGYDGRRDYDKDENNPALQAAYLAVHNAKTIRRGKWGSQYVVTCDLPTAKVLLDDMMDWYNAYNFQTDPSVLADCRALAAAIQNLADAIKKAN